MLIYKISDLIVFNALKNIKYGFLEVKKINGEVLKFGNPDKNEICRNFFVYEPILSFLVLKMFKI